MKIYKFSQLSLKVQIYYGIGYIYILSAVAFMLILSCSVYFLISNYYFILANEFENYEKMQLENSLNLLDTTINSEIKNNQLPVKWINNFYNLISNASKNNFSNKVMYIDAFNVNKRMELLFINAEDIYNNPIYTDINNKDFASLEQKFIIQKTNDNNFTNLTKDQIEYIEKEMYYNKRFFVLLYDLYLTSLNFKLRLYTSKYKKNSYIDHSRYFKISDPDKNFVNHFSNIKNLYFKEYISDNLNIAHKFDFIYFINNFFTILIHKKLNYESLNSKAVSLRYLNTNVKIINKLKESKILSNNLLINSYVPQNILHLWKNEIIPYNKYVFHNEYEYYKKLRKTIKNNSFILHDSGKVLKNYSRIITSHNINLYYEEEIDFLNNNLKFKLNINYNLPIKSNFVNDINTYSINYLIDYYLKYNKGLKFQLFDFDGCNYITFKTCIMNMRLNEMLLPNYIKKAKESTDNIIKKLISSKDNYSKYSILPNKINECYINTISKESIIKYLVSKNFSNRILYKINNNYLYTMYKKQTPSLNSKLLLSEKYDYTFFYNIIVYKSTEFINTEKNYIYNKLTRLFTIVFCFVSMFWIVLTIIICYFAFKVQNELIKQIKIILGVIDNIGKKEGEYSAENDNNLKIIGYPYDKDIDNFLFYYKKILIGAKKVKFSENENNLMLNIKRNSYIKNNNIIIENKFIENKTKLTYCNIFKYIRNNKDTNLTNLNTYNLKENYKDNFKEKIVFKDKNYDKFFIYNLDLFINKTKDAFESYKQIMEAKYNTEELITNKRVHSKDFEYNSYSNIKSIYRYKYITGKTLHGNTVDIHVIK